MDEGEREIFEVLKGLLPRVQDDEEPEDVEKEQEDEEEKQEDETDFIQKDEERQIATTIALKADRPDEERDTFPASVIEKAAHDFMEKAQDVNLEHEFDTEKIRIVESYIAPTDFEINGEKVQKGDWVVSLKFLDDKLWKFAKEGKLRGVSIEGAARKVPASEVE